MMSNSSSHLPSIRKEGERRKNKERKNRGGRMYTVQEQELMRKEGRREEE
jgi:hypothetical protein